MILANTMVTILTLKLIYRNASCYDRLDSKTE